MKKHLFIDKKEFISEISDHIELKMNHPDKLGPISFNVASDKQFVVSPYGTVMNDTGSYRMWTGYGKDIVDYRSFDGLNWHGDYRPLFGIYWSEGTIFKKPDGLEGSYGCLYFKENEGLQIMYSYKGLEWKHHGEGILLHRECDTQNVAFWDTRLKKYVCYLRGWVPYVFDNNPKKLLRAVVRYEVDNWKELKKYDLPNERISETVMRRVIDIDHTVFRPDCDDPPDSDIYTNAVVQYQDDVYLAFPSIYRHFQIEPGYDYREIPNEGILEIQMAVSRDGIRWNRFRQPYFPLGIVREDMDCSAVYMYTGMIQKETDILQYYWGSQNTHRDSMIYSRYDRKYGSLFVLRQRKDGFTYLFSDRLGKIITKSFDFKNNIGINADVNATGYMKVAILNEAKEPLTSEFIMHGNHINYQPIFEPIPGAAQKGKIRLKIEFADARLYGINT